MKVSNESSQYNIFFRGNNRGVVRSRWNDWVGTIKF